MVGNGTDQVLNVGRFSRLLYTRREVIDLDDIDTEPQRGPFVQESGIKVDRAQTPACPTLAARQPRQPVATKTRASAMSLASPRGNTKVVVRSLKSCESLARGPKLVGGRRIFRNFLEAHAFYKFPQTHRIGTIGNKSVGVIRSYSANHKVPAADGTLEWKDRFIFSDVAKDATSLPIQIFYRLKNEKIMRLFQTNMAKGTSLRFFKKLDEADLTWADEHSKIMGVWDLGLCRVTGFQTLPGAVRGTEFVCLELANV